MTVSTVSSTIFFLLLIITSLFIDGSVFATPMKHRKLGRSNGPSKIGTPRSISKHAPSKYTQNTPSQTHPSQTNPAKHGITYDVIHAQQSCGYKNGNCTKPAVSKQYEGCDIFSYCKKKIKP